MELNPNNAHESTYSGKKLPTEATVSTFPSGDRFLTFFHQQMWQQIADIADSV